MEAWRLQQRGEASHRRPLGLVNDSIVTWKTGLYMLFLFYFSLLWTGHHCRNSELCALLKKSVSRVKLNSRPIISNESYSSWGAFSWSLVLLLFCGLNSLIIFLLLIVPVMLVSAINIPQRWIECQPPSQMELKNNRCILPVSWLSPG